MKAPGRLFGKKVSIIIPVRNEVDHISICLDRIACQSYPKDKIEIVCVDGLSDDGTREIIQEYSRVDSRIRLLDNPERFVPNAMNIGIRASSGDIIVRIDARCIVEPDYISQCVHYLQTTGADNVGGPQRAVGESNLAKAIALATTSPFGAGGAQFRYSDKEQYVDTVYLGAFRREVFDRVGLYNESLLRNQDYELNYRIAKSGGRIYFSPKIRAIYYSRLTLGSLWRQYFQYGYWKVRTLSLHPRSLKLRQLAAPVFALSLILFAILALVVQLIIPLVSLIGVYLFGLVCAAIFATRRGKWQSVIWLLLVFPIIHISWGTGFLWGVATLPLDPHIVSGAGYR